MSQFIRVSLFALVLGVVVGACGPLSGLMPGRSSSQSSSHTQETINGQSIEDDDDDDFGRRKTQAEAKTSDIGATCHHNDECDARACFVGAGDLGYCTKMCNSFSDCPSFWECKRPGNAPQKICMQDD